MTSENLKIAKIKTGLGFIAALDQSGGSTPKALMNYGIKENEWSSEEEMFELVHKMRERIVSDSNFTGKQIIGAILFERTMNFSHSSSRACQVECYQKNSDKTEIRFYDSGVCLYKSMKHFKNVKSDNGMVIGVEYRHRFSIKKSRGKLKSLFRGTKKELQRGMRG